MWTCDLMEFYVWRLGLTFCSCVSIGHYCLCYNIDVAPPGHGIAWEARQNSWKMKTFAEKVAYLAKNQTTMFLRSPLMVRAFKVANVLHQRFARSLNIRPALPAVSCCYMSVVSKAQAVRQCADTCAQNRIFSVRPRSQHVSQNIHGIDLGILQ